jgi:hypothetical protein
MKCTCVFSRIQINMTLIVAAVVVVVRRKTEREEKHEHGGCGNSDNVHLFFLKIFSAILRVGVDK